MLIKIVIRTILVCVSIQTYSLYAFANEKLYHIKIDTTSSVDALNSLALQTQTQLLFSYDQVHAEFVNPVIGPFTVQGALKHMLQDTKLTGGLNKRGIIVISLIKQEDKMIKKIKKKTLLGNAGIFGLAAAFISSPTLAQEVVPTDEVIVTATKRNSTIQDVPFSINAQTQADIRRTGSTNLEELSRNIAGLMVQNLGPGQSQVAIRGVSAGQIVRDQPGVKEQVGIYLDESVISLSLFTPDLDLFDLNRVETLRGPQGTLFGSGSIGGTIRYITNQPTLGETSGTMEAEVNAISGGGMGGHVKGAINIPLGETTAIRAVGYTTKYGGFIDALREGGSIDENVNSGHRTGGRIALLWEPSDSFSMTPRVIYQEITADGFNRQEVFNLYANPFTTTRPAVTFKERQQFLLLDEKFTDEILIIDNTATLNLGSVELTSVTSYTDRDILVSRDASALTGSVSVDLGFTDAGIALPSNLLDTTTVEQITQELRIASNSDGALQWMFGGFYSNTDRFYSQTLPTPGYQAATDAALGAGTSAAVANGFDLNSPFNSVLPYTLTQTAIFGEASYDFNERLQVTVGGRYYDYEEERTITSGGLFANGDTGIVDTTKSSGFTPRVLMSYDISDNLKFNAQASKGFRLGGVNDPLNGTLCNASDAAIFGNFQDYDDESLWNYEAGFKGKSAGGIRFNAAVFYTDISNLQVTLDAGSCSSRVSFNVPKSHTQGVELEASIPLTDRWDIGVAGSIIESEFDSTVVDGGNNVLAGIEKGNRLPSVPKFQISGTTTYTFPVDFMDSADEGFISLTAQHVGSRITQPGDQVNNGIDVITHGLPFGGAPANTTTSLDLILPAYQTLNLRIGMNFEAFEVAAFINNLTDENALLSYDRERGGRARRSFRTNQPRTYGLTVRKDF